MCFIKLFKSKAMFDKTAESSDVCYKIYDVCVHSGDLEKKLEPSKDSQKKLGQEMPR